MAKVWKDEEIQYWELAPRILRSDGEQELVPFLGAGVSVSDRADDTARLEPAYPAREILDQVAALLGLDGHSRLYLEYAIRMAVRMQAWERANGLPPGMEQFRQKLAANTYPPFAWELAELFSHISAYHSIKDRGLKALEKNELLTAEQREACKALLVPMLKMAAMTTGLGSATDPLTSISSYYESTGERKNLWRCLQELMAPKQTPTHTHELIAEAARRQVYAPNAADYLIVTTNYDCLMESALEAADVPYVALRRNRRDGNIYARFANMPDDEIRKLSRRHPPALPIKSILVKNRSLAVVYKMHGCLHRDLSEADDGVVITDEDYVEFISRIDSIVPAHVVTLLGGKQVLFLGYSFSDWNVRSVYERVFANRVQGVDRDYAVTRSLSRFEEGYFAKRDIILIMASLGDFVQGIRDHAPKV